MDFDEFKQYVTVNLRNRFPEEEYNISIRKVVKNNGLVLDGLCIFKKGEKASPTIYLESYYEKYKGGSILAEILSLIANEYDKGIPYSKTVNPDSSSYEAVRSQIIMRLVNYEKNQEILKDCPHRRFHDLAITFRWLAHQDDIGISTALITNREVRNWQITEEILYQDAFCNTPRLFPGRIARMEDLLKERSIPVGKGSLELYVLSNQQGMNGATCILYDTLLENFSKELGGNFYLLPSSIHEMMICREQDSVTEEMLLSLVKEANHMVVTMGEVLSDNIYRYDCDTGQISVISNNGPGSK